MRVATLLLAAIGMVFGVPDAARAQTSDKPLRIVSPYAAGGVGDTVLRLMAESLRVSLGRPVLIDNRPGAAGRVGIQSVKDSPADGSVLLFVPIAPMSVFPHVYDNLGYDPAADFQPISQVATFDLAMAVGPAVPAKSVKELVDWLRINPGQASYGTPAAGSLPHFFAVLFAQTAGLELRQVPYKGNPPALADLMGGHLPIHFTSTQDLVEGHKSGRLRVLATSGAERSAVLTEVPTFREAGYAIQGDGWYGVYAPARTPPDIVAALNGAIVAASRTPEVRARMLALGLRPTGTSPSELARIQRADLDLWGPVIRASGFKPDQ